MTGTKKALSNQELMQKNQEYLDMMLKLLKLYTNYKKQNFLLV